MARTLAASAVMSADGRRQAIITYNASGLENGAKFRADLTRTAEAAFCG